MTPDRCAENRLSEDENRTVILRKRYSRFFNPLTGFYPAVTRQNEDGTPADGYYPEQRLTREEALRGHTIWPAYAAFLGDVVGSIEVGKYADLTVFDHDILEIKAAEILTTKVVMTIVGGRIVYTLPSE